MPTIEILSLAPGAKDLLVRGADEGSFRKAAVSQGWLLPMVEDLFWQLSQGNTSLDEAPSLVDGQGGARSAACPAPAAPASRLVLVADDEDAVRAVLRRNLERGGYAVREARTGVAALETIAREKPDLLLCDLDMPLLDGLGVIKTLRTEMGLWDLPILMLTVEGSSASQELAFKAGADDFVPKPFDEKLLMARVEALLRRAELRRSASQI